MSQLDDLLSQIPMDQLASALGVDPSQAEQAARTALPALFGGMEANAADPAGAASLAGALSKHDPGLVGAPLDQVDTADGEKIVQNIFGDNTSNVISALGATQGGGSSDLMQSLLPMLAPIVMSFLAGKMGGGLGSLFGGGDAAAAAPAGDSTGGGVLPGPSAAGAGSADPMGGLGDLLGSVLGGGSGSGGGGLDDLLGGVLGGMLGGGKR